ncbi:ketopantoate reductase family protein, partial [Citrobacter sp. AAK_AS5]
MADLREMGLVIRHYLQMRTTIARVSLVDRLDMDDQYDLCFVVTQHQQLDTILPEINASRGCRDFVLVGNNPAARATADQILQNSPV